MDLNIVVIAGRLAAAPELRTFGSGSNVARYLVTTRAEHPRRRVDVIPVVVWDVGGDALEFECGDRVWVAGAVQRRFWSDDHTRRSRIEIVARHIQRYPVDDVGEGTQGVPAVVEGSVEV
jgi:single-stranded DNA-binding protein